MPDPRRDTLSVGALSIQPADAPERWHVRSQGDDSARVEATWGEWVRLATRILEADALSRDLEARGDAWDQGHAAGAAAAGAAAADAGESVNPYR